MIERRQYERFSLPLAVVVEYRANGIRRKERAQVSDIAIGGARLPLATAVEIGSELDLSLLDEDNHLARALGLETTDGKPLGFRVNGRVVRRDRAASAKVADNYAIEFLSPLRISREIRAIN